MSQNLRYWDMLRRPPKEALRKITGGKMKGKTDISPAWRLEIMTSTFGPCGVGWKYNITKQWTEPTLEGQVMCFTNIDMYIKENDTWSDGIPGTGGALLTAKGGLHPNDDGWKMALTDALSVAMKAIGVAADIYLGNWDGSKYTTPGPDAAKKPTGTIRGAIFGCKDQKTLYELLCYWDEGRPIGPDNIKHWTEIVERVDELMDERGWDDSEEIKSFCKLVLKHSKEVQDETS